MMPDTLSDAALDVLKTADPIEKAEKSQGHAALWRASKIDTIGLCALPDRPARPEKPELCDPSLMPKRRKAGSLKGKIALLHALAHIELNAIDLGWDIIGRFAGYAAENQKQGFSLPREFYDQWVKVADDEAKHFLLLQRRLKDLGASYGDLPAHDGLWESAEATAHDFAARLAIVPMVLEARGLDVTPGMIQAMEEQGDLETKAILQVIHDDEITHVAAGTVWFKAWCDWYGYDGDVYWQDLVRTYFKGYLKPPFNDPSRIRAGLIPDWYEPLVREDSK